MNERTVPHNEEAEEGVVSCLLMHPRKIVRVADQLKPEHFLDDNMGTIYGAILSCHHQGKVATITNICYELGRREEVLERVGGKYGLEKLQGSLATLDSVEDYAGVITRTSRHRRLISAALEIANAAYHQEENALELAEELIYKIALDADIKSAATLTDAIDRYMVAYNERRKDVKEGNLPGIPTGFRDLDELLGRLKASKLYVMAAYTSIGKSSFALNMALNIIKQQKHVLFFSVEMDEDEIVQRLVSMESHIDQSLLRDGTTDDEQDKAVKFGARSIRGLDLKVDDSTYALPHIRSKAIAIHTRKRLDLIVVDYLQLVEANMEGRARNEMRYEEVGKLSKGLKRLSRELKVPVLALAQLNRKSADSEMPQLSHLGESSKLEQDSDVVMLIHCEQTELAKRNNSEKYRLNILVRKHRGGRIGQVELMFNPVLTRFDNKVPDYYEPTE